MKKRTLIVPIMGMALAVACGGHQPAAEAGLYDFAQDSTDATTIYGLACNGCNDTIVVLLRNIESDPDTFYILDASRQKQVFGHLRIGDMLAVVRNADDSARADKVIDLDDLKATWCYEVLPTLRKRADVSEADARQLLAKMPESLKDSLLVPREYGFQLKSENKVTPVGMSYQSKTSDEETPFEYPPLKRYRQWRLKGGQLILTETMRDSVGNILPVSSDTADLVLLRPDTLVLRFGDEVKGYYKKE